LVKVYGSFEFFFYLGRPVDDLHRLYDYIRGCYCTSTLNCVYGPNVYAADVYVRIVSQALLFLMPTPKPTANALSLPTCTES
jgi:hypothetical protein